MKSFLKKFVVLFSLLSFLVVSNLTYFAPTAKAQPWYAPNKTDFYLKVNDPDNPEEIFGERYTTAQVYWVFWGVFSFITDIFPGRTVTYCVLSQRRATGFIASADAYVDCLELVTQSLGHESGIAPALATIGENDHRPWHSVFTSRPISSVDYFKDIGQKLNIVPEAEAQGFGFEAARPLLSLWRAARNVTYLLLVFVIIAMAFMIMFRVKLSPQTVISVQSALPKIVVALILITFSYAIAGFLIDIMYVVIGLLAGIIYESGLVGSSASWTNIFEQLTNQFGILNFVGVYGLFFVPALNEALAESSFLFSVLRDTVFEDLIIGIVVLMIIFAAFKIVWLLIKTYVSILLLILAAPFQILIGTITGGGFTDWLKSMASNLAVYPTVGLMFFLSFLFLRAAGTVSSPLGEALLEFFGIEYPFFIESSIFADTAPWSPPLTVGFGESIELVWLAASVGIFMLIPKSGEIIKGFISGRPFAGYGTAIGAPLAASTGVLGYIPGQIAGEIGGGIRKAMREKVSEGISGTFFRRSERG